MKEIFTGIFKHEGRILTRNFVPGKEVYGEDLREINNMEYREWIPSRSKPSAAISKGLEIFPLESSSKILYLGAASGTTLSHFSDILEDKGFIYAVEFSPKVIKGLMNLSKERDNFVPLMIDARRPEKIASFSGDVDLIYQDISQRNQSEILVRNSDIFLDKGDHAMIAIKARSISSSMSKEEIFDKEIDKLSEHFDVLEKKELDPYEKGHLFMILRKK